jgi:hypothetical protein
MDVASDASVAAFLPTAESGRVYGHRGGHEPRQATGKLSATAVVFGGRVIIYRWASMPDWRTKAWSLCHKTTGKRREREISRCTVRREGPRKEKKIRAPPVRVWIGPLTGASGQCAAPNP